MIDEFRTPSISGGYSAEKELTGRRRVVDLYLRAVVAASARHPGTDEFKAAETMKLLYSRLRDAAIFEVPSEFYRAVADAGVAEFVEFAKGLPGEEYVSADGAFYRPDAADHPLSIAMTSRFEVPRELPAEVCYFALTEPTIDIFPRDDDPDDALRHVVALVVFRESDDASVVRVSVVRSAERDPAFEFAAMRVDRWGYSAVFNGHFAAVPAVVDWINSHSSTVLVRKARTSVRLAFSRSKRVLRMQPPPPFYPVVMRDEVRVEAKEAVKRFPRIAREYSHRWTVRGCFVLRVERGPLPLDPKTERRLRKDPRRRLFVTDPPDAETSFALATRRIRPKRPDEWLAALLYWRKPHAKGPEDAPFVPSVRRSNRS